MSARLDRIAALHGARLVAKVRGMVDAHPASVFRSPSGMVEYLAEYDPTPQHRYTQWLVLTFLGDGFLFEDLSKARETLELWHQHRHRLPRDQRDLNRHGTLASVWNAIEPFHSVVSGHAEDREERAAARAESLILHEGDDGFIVAVPMTERASNWWGRGTRWCTASTKGNNVFESYHQRSPLVVAVMPDGAKIQMTVGGGSGFHLMDSSDAAVSSEIVADRWAEFEPLIRWSLSKSVAPLHLVPEGRIEPRELRDSLLANPPHHLDEAGESIPASVWPLLSEDDLLAIIHHQNNVIGHIPAPQMTDGIIRASIQQQNPPDPIPLWWLESEPDAAAFICQHAPAYLSLLPSRYLTTELLASMADREPKQMASAFMQTRGARHLDWNKLRILSAAKGIDLYGMDRPNSPDRIEKATLAGLRSGLWPPFFALKNVPMPVAALRLAATLQSPAKRGHAWKFLRDATDAIESFVPEGLLTQDVVDACCLHCHEVAAHVSERWLSPVVRATAVSHWLPVTVWGSDLPARMSRDSDDLPFWHEDERARRDAVMEHIDVIRALDDAILDDLVRLVPRILHVLPSDRHTPERLGMLADTGDRDPQVSMLVADHEGLLSRLALASMTWDQRNHRSIDGLGGIEAAHVIADNVYIYSDHLQHLPPHLWSAKLMERLDSDGNGAHIPDWAKENWPETAQLIASRQAVRNKPEGRSWDESVLDGLRILLRERAMQRAEHPRAA